MSEPVHSVRIEPEIQSQQRAEWLALFSAQNAQLKRIVRALEGIEAHVRELKRPLENPLNLQNMQQYPQGYQRALSPEEIAKGPTPD
jgi:16S rRNA U516 pseudouridylate synthase RsuA-like enzyme